MAEWRLTRLIVWSGAGLVLTIWRLGDSGYGLQGDLPQHYHLARSVVAGMAAGEWWPAWAGLLEGGRGSSLFTFYAPLFYLLTGLIHLGGVPLISALGMMTVLILVFNQWTIWRLAGNGLTGWPRIWASVLGVALPGMTLITINRGFLPQALACGFLALVIDGAIRILGGEESRSSRLSLVAGLVGVVLSHTISAYLAALALVMLVVGGWHGRQGWRPVGRVAACSLLSAGLTAFFWIPQLIEINWVKVALHLEKQNYRDYLLFAKSGVSTPYREAWQGLNEVASLVTVVQSGLLLMAGLLIWRWQRLAGSEAERRMVRFGIIGAVFGLLISLPQFGVLWRVIPGLPYVQFPWRWQPVVGMVSGILAVTVFSRRAGIGGGLRLVGESAVMVLLVLGMILTSLLCRSYGQPEAVRDIAQLTEVTGPLRTVRYEESRRWQEDGNPEFLGFTANLVYFRPRSAETTIYSAVDHPGGLEIVDSTERRREREEVVTLHLGMEERRFRVRLSGEARARLLSYAYPRWQATVDGKPVPIVVEPGTGLMLVDLPAGDHELRFEYRRLRYPQLISLLVLAGTLIVLVVSSIRRRAWYTPDR